MSRTTEIQAALKSDIENITSLKLHAVEASMFYIPIFKEWLKYFLVFCISNLVVAYGLSYFGSFYIRGVHNLTRDIVLPNFFFAVAAVFVLSQYHIFRILAKNQIKSLDYIEKIISRFELIFLGLYVLFYAFCLHTEGDIAGTIMGSAVSGFVSAALTMGLVVMYESQRICLPVIMDLIGSMCEKIQSEKNQ